jgi:hypothetical protein
MRIAKMVHDWVSDGVYFQLLTMEPMALPRDLWARSRLSPQAEGHFALR